jgi:hypothetical protein
MLEYPSVDPNLKDENLARPDNDETAVIGVL